jgi:hypothetical protein
MEAAVGLESAAFSAADAASGRVSTALCRGNSNGPCNFVRSPHPAKALETMVIAREIVFMNFLFLPRVNPAYNLKGAIRDQELAPAWGKF